MVIAHDLEQGTKVFSLRANQAAVRAMHADTGRLTCAGDDGSVMAYDFGGGDSGKPRAGGSTAVTAAAKRESRLGKMNSAFGGGGGGGGGGDDGGGGQASAAQAYADKKRAAMEKAERIKAERRAKEQAAMRERPAWDDGSSEMMNAVPRNAFGTPLYPPGHPMGPGGGGGGGGAQSAAQSELDALHAAGDRKFGRGRR